MPQRITGRILTFFALGFVSATIAMAQSETTVLRLDNTYVSDWQVAQQDGPKKGKLFLVTVDQPKRRQSCRVQSFTAEKLVCSRGGGRSKTYLPQEVSALIIPGDHDRKIGLLILGNIELGAAIWGTVALAATCPACAVGIGIAALMSFIGVGAIVLGDAQRDRLLYLAPGQKLQVKLR